MNKKIGFTSALLFCCLVSAAQTNAPPASRAPLHLSPVRLWTAPTNSMTASGGDDSLLKLSQSQNQLTPNGSDRNPDFWTRLVEQSGAFYLTRPEPLSNSWFVRAVDLVLKPEVIPLGKARLRF